MSPSLKKMYVYVCGLGSILKTLFTDVLHSGVCNINRSYVVFKSLAPMDAHSMILAMKTLMQLSLLPALKATCLHGSRYILVTSFLGS